MITKTILKAEYVEMILADQEVLGKVAKAAGRDVQAIKRWANESHPFLTMAAVLNTVRDCFNIPANVELTEQVVQQKKVA